MFSWRYFAGSGLLFSTSVFSTSYKEKLEGVFFICRRALSLAEKSSGGRFD